MDILKIDWRMRLSSEVNTKLKEVIEALVENIGEVMDQLQDLIIHLERTIDEDSIDTNK